MKTFVCFSAQSLESQNSLTCNSSQVNGLRPRMNLAQWMTPLVLNVNLPCMITIHGRNEMSVTESIATSVMPLISMSELLLELTFHYYHVQHFDGKNKIKS